MLKGCRGRGGETEQAQGTREEARELGGGVRCKGNGGTAVLRVSWRSRSICLPCGLCMQRAKAVQLCCGPCSAHSALFSDMSGYLQLCDDHYILVF